MKRKVFIALFTACVIFAVSFATVVLMTKPAVASCGHYCMYRIYNRSKEPLEVIMAFQDGHRCEEVLKPGGYMYCTRHSYVPNGQKYAVMYSPNHILAGKTDPHRGVTMSCQWTDKNVRYPNTDWKVVMPSPGKCEIINSYW